mgnify:CR=1 FL=1
MITYRKYFNLIIAIFLLFAIASCDDINEPIVFDQEDAFVAFTSASKTIKEGSSATTYAIPVMVSAHEGSPAVTVDFDFATPADTSLQPAEEGVDFELINDSKSLNFEKGWGYDTIFVRTIPNGEFTGDKNFVIQITGNSQDYQDDGLETTMAVTLQDNEHPLNLVLGGYEISGTSDFYGDFTSQISIEPHPDNYTQVTLYVNQLIPGWGYTSEDIFYADVDLDAMTFKIQAGQSFPTRGYGPSIITGWFGADGSTKIDNGEYISGDIAADGTITINDWIGFEITSGTNEGLFFDIWQNGTVWSKTGKKKSGDVTVVRGQPRPFNR